MELTPDDIKTIREMRRWIQTNGQAGTVRPQYTRKPPRMLPTTSITFYNDTGETVPAYGIVRIQGTVTVGGREVLKVKKPGVVDGGPGSWFMANGSVNVEAGKYGVLQSGDLVKVVYDSGDSPSIRDWYGIDGFKARSFTSGKPYFQVLIEDVADSTNKIALARLIPYSTLMIQAPAGGIPGRVGSLMGSATCTIITRNTSNDQLAASTLAVKVHNWATSAACATGDRYGLASQIDGKWHIVAEDCNDEGSTVQPGTGSGTGGVVKEAIDTSTLSPVVTVGQFNNVNFGSSTVLEPS
jgi:hypothetical protein